MQKSANIDLVTCMNHAYSYFVYLTLANVVKKVHNHVLSHTDSDALLWDNALLGQCASEPCGSEAHCPRSACRRSGLSQNQHFTYYLPELNF